MGTLCLFSTSYTFLLSHSTFYTNKVSQSLPSESGFYISTYLGFKIINLFGLVLFDILDCLFQGEPIRVKSNEHVAPVPFLNSHRSATWARRALPLLACWISCPRRMSKSQTPRIDLGTPGCSSWALLWAKQLYIVIRYITLLFYSCSRHQSWSSWPVWTISKDVIVRKNDVSFFWSLIFTCKTFFFCLFCKVALFFIIMWLMSR